jgi:hypothetical protein
MKTCQTRPPASSPCFAAPLGALPPNPRDFKKAWQDKRMTRWGKKKAWNAIRPRPLGSFSRPGLVIPCRVFPSRADSVSPGPDNIYCAAGREAQNQPNAPTGSATSNKVKTTFVHLSVLTRPSVAGSNAPRDSSDEPATVIQKV